jgi:hypothetical protein
MTRTIAAALFCLALLLPAAPAAAQTPPAVRPHPNIDIAYIPPDDVVLLGTMRRLKGRRVLEQLSEFLSPLRLPHPFFIVTRQCDEINAFYDPDYWELSLCYEYVEHLVTLAAKANTPVEGMTHEDIVVGAVVGVLMHEVGHAVFDMLQVPMFGREEDAADAVAIFIALQFSKHVARAVVRSSAYQFIEWNWVPQEWNEYADEHGTDPQRAYNMLCIAHGGDPGFFKDFVDRGWLPKSRAGNCAYEFELVREAFRKTIFPFVDREKMKAVQQMDWLKSVGPVGGPGDFPLK